MKIRIKIKPRLIQLVLATTAAWSVGGGLGAKAQTNSQAWPGADLFVLKQPPRLELELSAEEAAKLRQDPREFVHGTLVEGGVRYPDVAVHLKGSVGSFQSLDEKPAFTLDFSRFHPGQRFHQLRRIHLNNSVEDPSYCCEQLGGELFRVAGIPAPRVARARIWLGGRKLGLYVLTEGFTEDFLGCYFNHVGGGLFEPGEGHDVNEQLKRASLSAPGGEARAALQKLSQAALTDDPPTRWSKLQETLDTGEFLKFMALEVMIGHRDGYCLARNNFRVYHDIDSSKVLFLPHGMDQLFGSAELPWQPHMAGLVARGVITTPEGEAGYQKVFREQFARLLQPALLTNRINQIVETLRADAEPAEFTGVAQAAELLKQHISLRWAYLKEQLGRPEPTKPEFKADQLALSGWTKGDTQNAELEECELPGTAKWLHIAAKQQSAASWKTKAYLPPGRYTFQGKARTRSVKPLPFGNHQGAGLRVAGQQQWSLYLVETASAWEDLKVPFEIKEEQEVEFICELRASAGDAWFEEPSLKVVVAP